MTISQTDLKDIIKKREALAKARILVKELTTDAEVMETRIMDRLKTESVAKGPLSAALDSKVGASRPPWKEIHERHYQLAHPDISWTKYEQDCKEAYPGDIVIKLVISDNKVLAAD